MFNLVHTKNYVVESILQRAQQNIQQQIFFDELKCNIIFDLVLIILSPFHNFQFIVI